MPSSATPPCCTLAPQEYFAAPIVEVSHKLTDGLSRDRPLLELEGGGNSGRDRISVRFAAKDDAVHFLASVARHKSALMSVNRGDSGQSPVFVCLRLADDVFDDPSLVAAKQSSFVASAIRDMHADAIHSEKDRSSFQVL